MEEEKSMSNANVAQEVQDAGKSSSTLKIVLIAIGLCLAVWLGLFAVIGFWKLFALIHKPTLQEFTFVGLAIYFYIKYFVKGVPRLEPLED